MADKRTFRLHGIVFFNGVEVRKTVSFEVSADSWVEAVDIATERLVVSFPMIRSSTYGTGSKRRAERRPILFEGVGLEWSRGN